MKERDGVPKPVQIELTSEAVNPTLIAGDIFMTDERGESPVPPPQGPGGETHILRDIADSPIDIGVRRVATEALGDRQGRRRAGRRRAGRGGGNRVGSIPVSLQDVSAEVVGTMAAVMRGGEAERLMEDVPTIVTYDYIVEDENDPEYGQIKTQTVDTTLLTFRGTMGQAGEAARGTRLTREEFKQRISEARMDLNQHISQVETSDTFLEIRQAANGFLLDIDRVAHLLTVQEMNQLGFREKRGRLAEFQAERDGTLTEEQVRERIKELKTIIREFSPVIRGHYAQVETRGEDMPRSLEDLVKLASAREEGEFARGGTKDLLTMAKIYLPDGTVAKNPDGTDMEEEQVNLANFYEWVRHQMWRVHDFNSTSEVNFFSDEGMGVKTTFRTINFYEIIFTPSFFRHKRSKWVPTTRPDGIQLGETQPVQLIEETGTDEDYRKLNEALLYEVYLFQLIRNGDFVYRENMAGVKGMNQAIQGIYKINPLTRDDYLERILSMPAMSRKALGEKGSPGKTIQEKAESNFIVGDAVRTAWDAYMNIWDFDAVAGLLGRDSAFFQREYDEFDDRGKTGNRLQGGGKFIGGDYDPTWFGPDGKVRDGLSVLQKEKYMEYMNLFLGPSRNQTQLKEIRVRMTLSLMEKLGLSLSEAKIAEAWAYSLCRFTGIAGRNDTESVGFDQWTKQGNLERYRQRQKSERRRANRGSKYTMADKEKGRGPGFKRITLTFVEAARDVHGRAIYEIMQGGQGSNINLEENPIKKDIDFERNYRKDGSGNIVFVTYNGLIVTSDKLARAGLLGTNRSIIRDGKVVFQKVTRDANGVEQTEEVSPQKYGFRPVKEDIVFRDGDGSIIEGLRGRVFSYGLDKNANPTFYDNTGNVVEVGDAVAQVVEREVQKIEFDSLLMTQFTANVIEMSSEWYEFIIDSKEMDLLGLVKGINSAGRPIFDSAKLSEVRSHIRKNITYALSTWAGTDYTKTIKTWEALSPGEIGYDPDHPERNHEMSLLRSMFGDEALSFIQLELQTQTRGKDAAKAGGIGHIDVWNLQKYHDTLNDDQKRELKIAIWTGIFTYMVAKEVQNHRALDSNALRWNHDQVVAVGEMLHDSGLLNKDEIPIMEQNTGTGKRRVFGEAFLSAITAGNTEGFWEMLKNLAKQPLV